MKKISLIFSLLCCLLTVNAESKSVTPDPISRGTYYGTNYTVPFAHAYRAFGELGVDRKKAIDRDVYHMARLGMNAFRLHLWDVELTDSAGNLLENDHLNLLDYLLAKLAERNIAVVLTAQTNFGNGYPEANTNPYGAYSYNFPKCEVHDLPQAQDAQSNYLDALVRHINPYTGKSYADDSNILAVEINNEPCHSGTEEQITAYINRMVRTLRNAGWDKEILYNVSHNLDRTKAFYLADIDGTTYQWYPTGLVHGSERRGNFLPMLDSYDIPFDTIEGFRDKSRVIYEYDPADVLETYLYPAATRSFRKAGFNWVTQFAYDPIDMAKFNTEYQTHFLNLAYTPGKAIGMLIAAEVMRKIPTGKNFGKYPVDTVFGDFLVSAKRDLAMLNNGQQYYHTNATTEPPRNIKKLQAIAGVGSSPLVSTDGTGAYFLDLLDRKTSTWRLEIMPDVIITRDPFAKPSLRQPVAETFPDNPVTINLSGLFGNKNLYISNLNDSDKSSLVEAKHISLIPGVYIISPDGKAITRINKDGTFGLRNNLKISEYVSPEKISHADLLVHSPSTAIPSNEELEIRAKWVGNGSQPDSLVIFPARASFWNPRNDLFLMKKEGKYDFTAHLDSKKALGHDSNGLFEYRIVAYKDGKATTYPGGIPGTPLDWDYGAVDKDLAMKTYSTDFIVPGSEFALLTPTSDFDGWEVSTIPEAWKGVVFKHDASLGKIPSITIGKEADASTSTVVLSKYLRDYFQGFTPSDLDSRPGVQILTGEIQGNARIGFVTRDGFTYSAPVEPNKDGVAEILFENLTLSPTLLNPAPYPSFLQRHFIPDPTTAIPFSPSEIESVWISVSAPEGEKAEIEIQGIKSL